MLNKNLSEFSVFFEVSSVAIPLHFAQIKITQSLCFIREIDIYLKDAQLHGFIFAFLTLAELSSFFVAFFKFYFSLFFFYFYYFQTYMFMIIFTLIKQY